jgi:hypothetical protein
MQVAILANKGYSRWIENIDVSSRLGGGIATADPLAWAFADGTTRDIAFRVAHTGHAYELWRTTSRRSRPTMWCTGAPTITCTVCGGWLVGSAMTI